MGARGSLDRHATYIVARLARRIQVETFSDPAIAWKESMMQCAGSGVLDLREKGTSECSR